MIAGNLRPAVWPRHRTPLEGKTLTGNFLISIIDDDDSLRAALDGLIRSLGHEARSFESAEAFLEAGEVQSCACIISDIQMPGMNGIDLMRHLTAQNVPTPVILITAHAEPSLRERAMASGAFCFLRKPFDADLLIDCLERALKLQS
jgi:FixJ family two-component response regulator